VDTALAGVLGACDGDLSLGLIVSSVAGLLDLAPEVLAVEILHRVRPLVRQGFLS
jgi:hypothetical protein